MAKRPPSRRCKAPKQVNAQTKGRAGATHEWPDLYLIRERERDFAGLPDAANPPKAKPRATFYEKPRPMLSNPELLARLADEAEFRDMQNHARAVLGGDRTIAPAPDARKVGNFQLSHIPNAELPVRPMMHKPIPASYPAPKPQSDPDENRRKVQAHKQWLAERLRDAADRAERALG